MLAWWGLSSEVVARADDFCVACNRPIYTDVYVATDKVTFEKVHICWDCEHHMPDCYLCGVPAFTNAPGYTHLPDGRAICSRDAKTAVFKETEGLQICETARDQLNRLLSRFMALPETNVTVAVVDRVNLQELFQAAGNDYQCPDIWGYTQPADGTNHTEHRISLMSALPRSWFQATCAHEYGHIWVAENLSAARKKSLSRDAQEGFCELLAWLLMDSLHDEPYKAHMLKNAYTRGQIDLFIAAERTFGLNDILDWMRDGTHDKLSKDEPTRIREVEAPRRAAPSPPPEIPAYRPAPVPLPDTLVLKAVFWDPKRPTAMINDRTFGVNEEAKVRLASTNLTVRCLAIRQDSVRLRVIETGEETELSLRRR